MPDTQLQRSLLLVSLCKYDFIAVKHVNGIAICDARVQVRSRCSYLFSRFVRCLKFQLLPFTQDILTQLQPMLAIQTQRPANSELLGVLYVIRWPYRRSGRPIVSYLACYTLHAGHTDPAAFRSAMLSLYDQLYVSPSRPLRHAQPL